MSPATSISDWAAVRVFPGADAVVRAQGAALPQPDQLCGPFAAAAALSAVLDRPPSIVELARRSGTAIWPHDIAEWRPSGAALDRTGWDRLPVAPDLASSGTNAAGLAAGIESVTGGAVAVVPGVLPDTGVEALRRLLAGVLDAAHRIGVVANVCTGPLAEAVPGGGPTWDVGHFVVLWGSAEGAGGADLVALADSYRELGTPGAPAGCRLVTMEALAQALSASPGRGLLLLVGENDRAATTDLVHSSGLISRLWVT